ncbi:MAG: xylulokinase [Planctomycetaceae bacterium]|nr:xylulokinase [Planctomycetaceae bacterium]
MTVIKRTAWPSNRLERLESPMQKLILAHDIGTSATKATLFSLNGTLVASTSHPYETRFGQGGSAEQNPLDWWDAVCITTKSLMQNRDAEEVVALALSGMMMGCLCVDRLGTPLRNHLLYCDQRAVDQAARLGQRAGKDAIYTISGNRANAVNSAAKFMWIKENEPETYRNTYKFLNAKDFINFKLTGCFATDPTDASGTNLYDLKTGTWSPELIEAAELDVRLLPDIVPSTSVLGELTSAAATDLGLRPGTPVVEGAADGICAGIGAGSIAQGKTYICLGSSAWVGITTDEPVYDQEQRSITFAHAIPGKYHPMGTMLAGGSLYSWLRSVFHPDDQKYPYARMDEIAQTSKPGANGLLFLPHLMGERSPHWNSVARGAWIGLDITHSQGDLFRAVLESVALNLEVTVSIFKHMVAPINELTIIGGGAKGKFWRQIMADIIGTKVFNSSNPEEATAIGAAVIAGVGAGLYKDFSVVEQYFSASSVVEPNSQHNRIHSQQKTLYIEAYKALEPLLPALATLREQHGVV